MEQGQKAENPWVRGGRRWPMLGAQRETWVLQGYLRGLTREPNSLLCQLVKWTSWYQGGALCRVTHLGSLPSSPHCSPDLRCCNQPLLLPCLYPLLESPSPFFPSLCLFS